jgi:hypothetical protein
MRGMEGGTVRGVLAWSRRRHAALYRRTSLVSTALQRHTLWGLMPHEGVLCPTPRNGGCVREALQHRDPES